MKIKDGKKAWFMIMVVLFVIYLGGVIGSIIINKNLDSVNATHTAILMLLIANISSYIEKK